MGSFNFKVITQEAEWDKIGIQWDEVLSDCLYNDLFLTFEWLRTWWSIFGNGELSIILVEDNGEIAAIAPLYIRKKSLVRVLGFIGSGVSDYGGILIRKKYDFSKVTNLILDYARKFLKWNVIDLHDVSEDSPLFTSLRINIEGIGKMWQYGSLIYESCKCVYIPLAIADSPHKEPDHGLISQLRNREKALAKKGEVSFETLQQPDSNVMNALWDLHIKRWSKDNKMSNFTFRVYRQFYLKVSEELASKGWLSYYLLKCNGEFAAIIYGFTYNNKIYDYIPTYNFDFAVYSPGNILLKKIIDYASKSGITEIDLLRGNEGYKYRWSKMDRANYRFISAQKGVKGVAYLKYVHLKRYLSRSRLVKGIWEKAKQFVNILKRH